MTNIPYCYSFSRQILRRLSLELVQHFGLQEEIPDDFKELCQAFSDILEQASFKGRIVIVIDAIDQLEKIERAQEMKWLPISPSVKFVLSMAEQSHSLAVLRKRKASPLAEVLVGSLSVKERRELVQEILKDYRKKLDER